MFRDRGTQQHSKRFKILNNLSKTTRDVGSLYRQLPT